MCILIVRSSIIESMKVNCDGLSGSSETIRKACSIMPGSSGLQMFALRIQFCPPCATSCSSSSTAHVKDCERLIRVPGWVIDPICSSCWRESATSIFITLPSWWWSCPLLTRFSVSKHREWPRWVNKRFVAVDVSDELEKFWCNVTWSRLTQSNARVRSKLRSRPSCNVGWAIPAAIRCIVCWNGLQFRNMWAMGNDSENCHRTSSANYRGSLLKNDVAPSTQKWKSNTTPILHLPHKGKSKIQRCHAKVKFQHQPKIAPAKSETPTLPE